MFNSELSLSLLKTLTFTFYDYIRLIQLSDLNKCRQKAVSFACCDNLPPSQHWMNYLGSQEYLCHKIVAKVYLNGDYILSQKDKNNY